jgi:transposase
VGAVPVEQWAPNCRIVYDKFHVMQHANAAMDEVRRAEFFRKGGRWRGLVKGKRWLLLTRWVDLTSGKRRELNALFALNRRLLKAYLLKESLNRLWDYRYEGAMLRYLTKLDRSASLAASAAVPEAGRDAARPPGGNPELLPNEGAAGGGRGGQR